ncbi:MAG: hypothetical protein A2W99_05000 [Bacteroidetes bacterium GWF2_33_16]|nr:MAG: hypothetical protein A2X00_17520 [Bacteroidetes bacterium GWE2_32_14]OFY06024.1 MAG: hypothetical protein A2W99_05000 [Bacteroidetes bacterium GWF2_33_16]
MFTNSILLAQWQKTTVPFGGIVNCVYEKGDTVLAGTSQHGGFFFSPDGGDNWVSRKILDDYPAVQTIEMHNDTLFVGSNQGISFSTNFGETWSKANINMTAIYQFNFLNNFAYAGTSSGLYKSIDHGLNWERIDTTLTQYAITSVEIKDSCIFSGTWMNGLFRSTDHGVTWTPVNNGLTQPFIRNMLIDGDDIFVGTASGGLFLSTDNGENWVQKNNGLYNWFINDLEKNENFLYVGTWDGVYISDDNGDNWNKIVNGLIDTEIRALSVDDSILYAATSGHGIFKSDYLGTEWTEKNNGLAGLEISALVTLDGKIIAGTDMGGVFVSSLTNLSWTPCNDGLPVKWITSMVALGNTIVAGNDGIYTSKDYGQNWNEASTGLTSHQIDAMLTLENKIFIGTFDGVFMSEDTAKNWTNVSNGLTDLFIQSLSCSNGNLFTGPAGVGIFMSTDTAKTWINISNDLLSSATVSAILAIDTCIYAGTRGYGVLITKDYGQSWTMMNNGLNIMGELSINSLNHVGDTIIAGTEKGMFVFNNEDSTWHKDFSKNSNKLNIKSTEIDSIAISTIYNNNYYLYVGTKNSDIWIKKLRNALSVSNENLIIGSEENSTVSFNITSNTNWLITNIPSWLNVNFESGTGNKEITITAEENSNESLRSDTLIVTSEGVESKKVVVTQQGNITGLINLGINTIYIYPNPTNNLINIKNLDANSRITITNLQGISIIDNECKDYFDLSSFNAGIYLVKIKFNNSVIVKKVIKY